MKGNLLFVSIMVSAFVHLFWMSIVIVVVAPNVEAHRDFGNVSFLGAILEKSAFDASQESKQPAPETLFKPSVLADSEASLELPSLGRKKYAAYRPYDSDRRINTKVSQSLGAKAPEPYSISLEKKLYYHAVDEVTDRLIEGPARERTVIYRPSLPAVDRKRSYDQEIFDAKYRFKVARDGAVTAVEPVSSTGYPEIDNLCVDYLKQFKFAPVIEGERGGEDWGIMTIKIRP